MGYSTILVYCGQEKLTKSLTIAAASLCRSNDNARIIGLHVIPQVPVYPDMAFLVTSELVDMQRTAMIKQAEETRHVFESEIKKFNIPWEWRTIEAGGTLVADRILDHGRNVDVIIGAQDNPETDNDTQYGITEQVLIRAGRPVLFIPYQGEFTTIGRKVLIAWNGSREAARATFDALPVLKKAECVDILWASDNKEHNETTESPVSEISATLLRHDVPIRNLHAVDNSKSFSDELLARLGHLESDLLVMGGYGHSRFREFVFGGATHDVLQHMTIPVLMSH